MINNVGPERVHVSEDEEVPDEFLCPISLHIMEEPVTLVTGITYDRPAIARWLEAGHYTCPTTRQPLPSTSTATAMVPNLTLRRLILLWKQAHPQHPASTTIPEADNPINNYTRHSCHTEEVQTLLSHILANHRTLESLKRLHGIVLSDLSSHRDRLHSLTNPSSLPPGASAPSADVLIASLLPVYGPRTGLSPPANYGVSKFLHRRSVDTESRSEALEICAEALAILRYQLPHLSREAMALMCDARALDWIVSIFCGPHMAARLHAVKVLDKLFTLAMAAPGHDRMIIPVEEAEHDNQDRPPQAIRAMVQLVLDHGARIIIKRLLETATCTGGRKASLHVLLVLLARSGVHGFSDSCSFDFTSGHDYHQGELNTSSQSMNITKQLVRSCIDNHAIAVLLKLLSESSGCDRLLCETALALLCLLLCYPQGRAAAIAAPETIPVLVKQLLRVSSDATEAAMDSLLNLLKALPSSRRQPQLVQAAMEAGALQRLLAALQTSSRLSSRTKAKELVRLLNQRSSTQKPARIQITIAHQ